MVGVEILASSEAIVAYEFSWQAYLLSIAITAILMAIVSFCTLDADLPSAIFGLLFGVLVGLAVGLFPACNTVPSEYETHYKVIISDEVSMNEFLERYEIIDQEGKIYTVRERNEESE